MPDFVSVFAAPTGLLLILLSLGIATHSALLSSLFGLQTWRRSTRWLLTAATAIPGVAMLTAALVPFLVFFAALMSILSTIALQWVGRATTSRTGWLLSAGIIAASLAAAGLQPLGLKVLLLPKADRLPVERAPAQVVKIYDEGVWFEGVAAGSDGTLYLAANRDLNFSDSKYYRNAEGEVIARTSDGMERILFRTPKGTTAGVIAVGDDGTLFMTSNGDEPGIWRIRNNGSADKMTSLPRGAWPNGLDFGPDGKLYSPDSNLARVWRIDPANGAATIALSDNRLAARRFISLAPGANGLHFSGRNMIVTVSDSTEVLSYAMDGSGRFGAATLLAKGIPGDDFAIGHDGSLFITTHPYNTLVRVEPSGRRTIIGEASQNIIGATDAVFGRSANDRNLLYVVTDGGAFTGGARTRGALIAVEPYARS